MCVIFLLLQKILEEVASSGLLQSLQQLVSQTKCTTQIPLAVHYRIQSYECLEKCVKLSSCEDFSSETS